MIILYKALLKVIRTMKHEAKWVEQTYPKLSAISEEASTVSSVSDNDYQGNNTNKKEDFQEK